MRTATSTPCHFLWDQTYNGYSRAEVLTDRAAPSWRSTIWKNGVVTRGVLIDIPRLKGLPWLEPGTPVFVEDIEAPGRSRPRRLAPGDAIFLRTGTLGAAPQRDRGRSGRTGGYHASVAPWLKARGVAFLGGDDAQDVTPSLVEGMNLPVHHTPAIAALGIDILDNQDLKPWPETAARLEALGVPPGRVAPVPVTGGTGFPANALAIF